MQKLNIQNMNENTNKKKMNSEQTKINEDI